MYFYILFFSFTNKTFGFAFGPTIERLELLHEKRFKAKTH